MTAHPRSGLRKRADQPYATLQFNNAADRRADQARRDALNAYRERLGVTVQQLADLLSALHGSRVSYWTVRAWTAGQQSRRARLTPTWAIKRLDEHYEQHGRSARRTPTR